MPKTTGGASGLPLGRAAVVLLGVMGGFLIGRCSAPDGDGDGDSGGDLATEDDPDVVVEMPATTWGPDEAPNLVMDRPDAVLSALRDELHGPLTVRRVVIYPEYAWAEVQDPTNPQHLDEYDFRDGIIEGEPTPVSAGRYRDWRNQLYPLETVKADVVRAVAALALDKLDDLENPVVQYIEISRGYDSDACAYTGEVELYVSVSDPIRGGSGTMRTDAQGNVIEIRRS